MPATLETDLREGIRFNEDPDTGRITYTLTYHVYGLTAGTPAVMIAEALGEVPARGTLGPIAGTYVTDRVPEPWGANECTVMVNYASPRPGSRVGDAPRITGGTTLNQGETQFDAANLALAFTSRTPISVAYDPTSAGAPGAGAQKQGATVPILVPQSVITYTRRVSSDPSGNSRIYTGKKNSDTFKGVTAGKLLVLAYEFDSDDGGATYEERISIAYDPDEQFDQVARWVDPVTGKPPTLTNAQLAASNGIKRVVVQGSVAYSGMGL